MKYIYPCQTDDIILLVNRETYKITLAAYDHIWLRERLFCANPGTMAVTGDFGHMLFEAVAGRNFWESPKQSSKDRALSARGGLLELPSFEIPWDSILANYKDKVFPFFQKTILTKEGNISPPTQQQWEDIFMLIIPPFNG